MKEVIISETLVRRFKPKCRLCKRDLRVGDKAERRGRKKVYYICGGCCDKFETIKA